MHHSLRSIILGIGLCLLASAPAHATNVAVKLLLLVDVSGSVDASEYGLQKTGYVQAFQNAAIQNFIANSAGGIAVAYAEWSGAGQQAMLVNWTHLTDAASSNAFASAINSTSRAYNGSTAVQSALAWGVSNAAWFNAAGSSFTAVKDIIDISGDGERNDGLSGTVGRDAALAVVDTINGLIIDPTAGLTNYYTNNVIGGTGGTLYTAANFASFGTAVANKIFVEIGGEVVPEPSAFLPLAGGVLALWHIRRRKIAKKNV